MFTGRIPLVSWSDDYTTALSAGQTVSLRANGGPDGDKYWNNAPAGNYTIRAHVADVNRIAESNNATNTLDASIVVQSANGVLAVMADAVIESMGVNFHLSRPDEASNFTSGINLKQKLAELGIRHIRDGAETTASGYASRLVQLYNELGVKVTLIRGTDAPLVTSGVDPLRASPPTSSGSRFQLQVIRNKFS